MFPALPVAADLRDPCSKVDVPVVAVEERPTQYAAFCRQMPDECTLSGDEELRVDAGVATTLARVNRDVNGEIVLTADAGCSGGEEHWSRPASGYGDCEDFALEKRARLREAGLPSATMTMAIVHHRTEYFAHAVLLVETDRGTFLLDNLTDEVICWRDAPYSLERRERPDGLWERFAR